MSPRQIDIADMQCWLLRMAEKKWHMPAPQVAALFQQHDVFGYVADLYDILHLSSYDLALADVEGYLKNRGALLC
ncbi:MULTISPECIES: DUF3791 domain-containing protein [unclassified Adlercreutzia]|uniref:DUF3791 domain-containing protein n=1 Tax=unclassified Adlercreutzia TaxID=2636013 RepID=UPI0013ED98A7|nr:MULTISPECIES: DUF3791 domain-containing protein [unclassified Adlercreutzia]